ncbi:MAG: ABC transporter permease [Verrucomicrobiota bacterium]
MLRKISAIAKDTVRKLARSGTAACAGMFFILSVLAVSLSTRGDGVLASELSVTIRYSLAVAVLILSVITLWVSCGEVSREAADRRIHVVVTKPLQKIEIWLGKWLGIMALNFVALAAAFLLVYAIVSVRMASAADAGEVRNARTRVVTARRSFPPINRDFTREARKRLAELKRQKAIPSGATDQEIVEKIRRRMIFRHYTVSPGESGKWIFRVPVDLILRNSKYCSLDFKFMTPGLERLTASGTWKVSCVGHTNSFTHGIVDYPAGRYSLDIPMAVFSPAADSSPKRYVEIEAMYSNTGGNDEATIMLDPHGGLAVMIEAGTFEFNLFRSFIVGISQLGMIAAAGLAAGACFSFPVAAFVSSCIAAVALLADYFRSAPEPHAHHHGAYVEPGAVEKVMESFAERLSLIFEPLSRFNALDSLSDGQIIPWSLTLEALVAMGIAAPLLLGCVAWVVLSGKEFK